jgi:hypothetical protein
MSFEIKQATRQGVKPLIGIYSESGCGKTMSSLLLARGFVGATGKIVMLDTESGRGSLYADVIPGGYEVIEMREPFSPARYIEAIQTVEQSGAAILIIDSGSHEWEGIGGVLDMATDNESRSGKPGLHNWKQPKMEHAKFMLKMLQSPLPIVVCLRAKYKTRQTKENGKTVIVKDDYTTPIQADQFIFEMTAHGEILQDHSLHLTKCSHPSLRGCFPEGEPITSKHGELLAAWCNSAGKPIVKDEAKELKAELWALLKPIRKAGDKTWQSANDWLLREEILDAAVPETAPDLNPARFQEVITKAREILSKQ